MTPEQAAELRKPFPASAIGKLPKGGTQLDYVGHAATTDRLLSVDPEWSWEPVAFDEHGLPAFQGKNLWIKLTVCGVTRYGIGDGTSVKECIGDAIRNAAMRFGVALDLWSKEELEQSHGPATVSTATLPSPGVPPTVTSTEAPAVRTMSRAPAPASRDQITKIQAQFGDLGFKDRDAKLGWIGTLIGRQIESSNDLTKAEASRVIEALDTNLAAAAVTP
jgi:hypothetical protein